MRKRKLTEDQSKQLDLQKLEWAIGEELGSIKYEEAFGQFFEGAPAWCQRELDREYNYPTFRTVVYSGGDFMSSPDEEITDASQDTWKLCETYTFSGETECPVPDDFEAEVKKDECILVSDPYGKAKYSQRNDRRVRAECPMCEERLGSPHGSIYVGEGYEAVYRLVEEEEAEENA